MDLCNMMQFNLTDFLSFNDTFIYEESLASRAELAIRKVVPPILIVIGIPGNILTFVAMVTLANDVFSLCSYLCLVAVLDCVLLFIEAGNEWLHQVSLQNIVHAVTTHSDTSCKLYNFSQSLAQHHNVWIIVSFAIELIVLMYYPEKLRELTSSRVRDTIALISVLLICANCHYFWTFGINTVEMNYGCTHYSKEFCSYQTRTLEGQLVAGAEGTGFLWSSMHQMLATLLPSITFAILVILYVLRRKTISNSELRSLLQESIYIRLANNRENQANGLPYERRGVRMNAEAISQMIWKTVPALCISHIFCHIPLWVHNTLELSASLHGDNGDAWSLAGVVFQTLKNISYSFKFILYLATSKSFRFAVKTILKKVWNSVGGTCTTDGYRVVHRRTSKVDVQLGGGYEPVSLV